MPTDVTEKDFLTYDGHRLAYHLAGNPEAPPLIMVHGWLSHAGIWRQTIDPLRDSFYMVAVDLLGHGHSDKPTEGNYSIPAQAVRVLQIANSLGIETFDYMGHSMGGQIGLYLALIAPNRVKRLVLVSPVVTGELSNYVRQVLSPIYRLGMLFNPLWDLVRPAVVRYRWVSSIFDRPLFFRPVKDEEIAEDKEMAITPGIETAAFRDLQEIRKLNLTKSLVDVQAPTLVIFGREDFTVPIINGALIDQYVPQSRLVILDNCGHVPMVEKTEEYLKWVRRFLLTPESMGMRIDVPSPALGANSGAN